MAKRMLIDATHPEETRVVVLNGNRLEEFDFEASTKKQVKGNIYLAKVTRVEPSLQAAFVEYGGNRHGFLAFSEIHPDYYRIPVADRRHIAGYQSGDPVPLDTGGDVTDEGGVPLEEVLPEPVAVIAVNPDDTADHEPFSNSSDPSREDELPAPSAQADTQRDFGWGTSSFGVPGESEAPTTEPIGTALPQTERAYEEAFSAEKPSEPRFETTTSENLRGDTPPDAPARGWVTAAARDEVVVAPDELMTTPSGETAEVTAPTEARDTPSGVSDEGDVVDIGETRAIEGRSYTVIEARSGADSEIESGDRRPAENREGDFADSHPYSTDEGDIDDAHAPEDEASEGAQVRSAANSESEKAASRTRRMITKAGLSKHANRSGTKTGSAKSSKP